MKQIRRRLPSALYTLPFLLFCFILIVVSSFLLAINGFDGVFSATLFNSPRGILLLVVGPLGLLVFLSLFFYGIVSSSFHHGSTNRFLLRIFFLCILLIFSATFPQTVIVCRYVSTALGSWFNAPVVESLEYAEKMTNAYTEERLLLIGKVSSRFMNGLAIVNFRTRPTDWMSEIRSIDSHAVAYQAYVIERDFIAPVYVPVIEIGDSARFFPVAQLSTVTDGLLRVVEKDDVFRYAQIVRYSNNSYVCIYTSATPAGYLSALETIKTVSAQARVIDTLKPHLPLMGIWIYAMFALPSILMVVILAFYASSLIAEPVCSLNEAAGRLAEGDDTFIIVSHSSDELSGTAVLLNAVAENLRVKKKPEKKVVLKLKDPD